MNKKEREYQEYLALREHEQEEEIKREYLEQKRGRGGASDASDEKYGQYFPENRKNTRRYSGVLDSKAP